MDEMRLCRSIDDEALLARLKSLVARERSHLAGVLACLGETDRRKLFAPRGFQSVFDYCVSELRYSEGATYRRIHAARAARDFPEILSYVADGSLSLSAVSLLAPHLTAENGTELLSRAQGKRKRELERMIADVCPLRADRPDCIRYVDTAPVRSEASDSGTNSEGLLDFGLPAAAPGLDAGPTIPASAPGIARPDAGPSPSGPVGVRFAFTASEGLLQAVERARDLLRNKYPSAKLEDVFREAILEYLDRHDPERRLARKPGRPVSEGLPRRRPAHSPTAPGTAALPGLTPRFLCAKGETRRIPRWVRDQVWERDGGRCSFVAGDGRRCQACARLEFDHVQPWALGGRSDDPANVRLLCRTHNLLAARQIFGNTVEKNSPARNWRAEGAIQKLT